MLIHRAFPHIGVAADFGAENYRRARSHCDQRLSGVGKRRAGDHHGKEPVVRIAGTAYLPRSLYVKTISPPAASS